MRHRLSGRQLGRDGSARKALFRSLTCALVREEQIKTTLPKAKELRRFVERLITIAKVDSTAHRRLVFSRVADAKCVPLSDPALPRPSVPADTPASSSADSVPAMLLPWLMSFSATLLISRRSLTRRMRVQRP